MNEDTDSDELAPWLVILLTLVGGGLRVLLLDQKGLWLNETISVWLANHNVTDLVHWTATLGQHPPLYYLTLHYWLALTGDTPYYARLLSAIFGTGTIPIIYLIGKRLSGTVVGLAAAVFLAFSPFNIRFAQETGMYTFLTFNAAVAMYALVRLLTDPRSVRPIGSQFRDYVQAWRTAGPVEPAPKSDFSYKDMTHSQTGWRGWIYRHRWLPIQAIETDLAWVAFIVFSAATLLSHAAAVLFPLTVNLFVLGLMLSQRRNTAAAQLACQSPSLENWVKAQLAIFLLWSPWLLNSLKQAGAVYQDFWLAKPSLETIVQALQAFANYSPLDQSSQQLIWLLYTVLFCLAVWHYRTRISRFLLLTTLFAIPFLAELIVSVLRPVFLDRTLIWTTVPLFLILAAGVAQLRFRLLVIAAVGILGAQNLLTASDYFRFAQKEDWSTAAGYVAKFAQKDDLVLFNDTLVQIPFDYYFGPFEKQYAIQVEKRGLPVDMLDSGNVEPRMTTNDLPRLMSLINGRNRVWLVCSHNGYADPSGLLPQTLASHMSLTRTRDFYGGQVQLYESP